MHSPDVNCNLFNLIISFTIFWLLCNFLHCLNCEFENHMLQSHSATEHRCAAKPLTSHNNNIVR